MRRAAAVVAVVGLCIACSDDGGSSSADATTSTTRAVDEPSTPSDLAALTLLPGQCIDLDNFVVGEPLAPASIRPAACDAAHRAEVYDAFPHTAALDVRWPGETAVSDYADDECLKRFSLAIGSEYRTSAFDFTTLSPDEDAWNRGERQIICIAYPLDGQPLVGTILHSGR